MNEKLKSVKAVVFPSIGVLFSAHVLYDAEHGELLRERSHIDGQGISLLRSTGIHIAFVSSEKGGFLTALTNKLNSLASVKSGAWEEIALFEGVSGQARIDAIDVWLAEKKCTKEECLYMGHDVGDYVCMKYFGISATPISAEKIVKDIAGLVTEREAGRGAVRDLANAILESKGIKPLTLSQK